MEPSVQFHEVIGWAAAALTLLAFSCNDLLRLRYTALQFCLKFWPKSKM